MTARSVVCPRCRVGKGEPCLDRSQKECAPHTARTRLAATGSTARSTANPPAKSRGTGGSNIPGGQTVQRADLRARHEPSPKQLIDQAWRGIKSAPISKLKPEERAMLARMAERRTRLASDPG